MTAGAVFLWTIVGAYLNALLVGPMVWAACDDAERSWFKWYESLPAGVAWWAQPLVTSLWPVAVCMAVWRLAYRAVDGQS